MSTDADVDATNADVDATDTDATDGYATDGHANHGHADSKDDSSTDQHEIKPPTNEEAKVPLHHYIEIIGDYGNSVDIVFVRVEYSSTESKKREQERDAEMVRLT